MSVILQPLGFGDAAKMSFPGFVQQRALFVWFGVVIDKAALFLYPPGVFIPLEIAAPDRRQSQVFEAVAQHLPHSFRNKPPAPERDADPIAELAAVSPYFMAVFLGKGQINASDGAMAILQHDGIGFFGRKHFFDDLPAVFNAGMGPMRGSRAYSYRAWASAVRQGLKIIRWVYKVIFSGLFFTVLGFPLLYP